MSNDLQELLSLQNKILKEQGKIDTAIKNIKKNRKDNIFILFNVRDIVLLNNQILLYQKEIDFKLKALIEADEHASKWVFNENPKNKIVAEIDKLKEEKPFFLDDPDVIPDFGEGKCKKCGIMISENYKHFKCPTCDKFCSDCCDDNKVKVKQKDNYWS